MNPKLRKLSLVFFSVLSFGLSTPSQSQSSIDWNKRIDALVESLPGFFGPQTTPTEPIPIARALPEWEPSEALVVGIPLKVTLGNPRIFEYYASLIEVAGQYVDLAVLHSSQDDRSLDLFLKRLAERGVPDSILNRIRFTQCQISEYWVRDFGPLFGLAETGELILFDNSDRTLIEEKDAWSLVSADVETTDPEIDAKDFATYNSRNRRRETVPMFVATHIRKTYGITSDVVRPPLHLQCGDYITDGKGRFFISEDTILGNSGQLKYVDQVFRDYYGADQLIVLNALPGITAKHLDLMAKLVDEKTLLLAESPSIIGDHSPLHYKRLTKEIEENFNANVASLSKRAPDIKILRVPMLPPVPEDRQSILHRIRSQIFACLCEEAGISYLRFLNLEENDSQRELVRRKVAEHSAKQFGQILNPVVDEDLNQLTQVYLGSDLNTLIETNVDTTTVYRSYLNSVRLITKTGEDAWLLPRYKPRLGESAEGIAAVEKKVEEVYRSVTPSSEIHWIDSDAMAEMLGAIHCTTFTIPSVDTE